VSVMCECVSDVWVCQWWWQRQEAHATTHTPGQYPHLTPCLDTKWISTRKPTDT